MPKSMPSCYLVLNKKAVYYNTTCQFYFSFLTDINPLFT